VFGSNQPTAGNNQPTLVIGAQECPPRPPQFASEYPEPEVLKVLQEIFNYLTI
jgi:hypothetical protein